MFKLNGSTAIVLATAAAWCMFGCSSATTTDSQRSGATSEAQTAPSTTVGADISPSGDSLALTSLAWSIGLKCASGNSYTLSDSSAKLSVPGSETACGVTLSVLGATLDFPCTSGSLPTKAVTATATDGSTVVATPAWAGTKSYACGMDYAKSYSLNFAVQQTSTMSCVAAAGDCGTITIPELLSANSSAVTGTGAPLIEQVSITPSSDNANLSILVVCPECASVTVNGAALKSGTSGFTLAIAMPLPGSYSLAVIGSVGTGDELSTTTEKYPYQIKD